MKKIIIMVVGALLVIVSVGWMLYMEFTQPSNWDRLIGFPFIFLGMYLIFYRIRMESSPKPSKV